MTQKKKGQFLKYRKGRTIVRIPPNNLFTRFIRK